MQNMDVLVKFDYNAQDADELTIRKGDRIRSAFKKEDGWMEGEVEATGKRGLFPDNYVEIINKSAQMANTEKRKNFLSDLSSKFSGEKKASNGVVAATNGGPVPVQQSTSPRPPPVQNKPQTRVTNDAFKARVVYSYLPANEDELSIQENDVVDVLRVVEDGWYEGVCNGKKGVFPTNYVSRIEPTDKSLNSSTDDLEIDDRKASKKVVGVGLGNIFSGKPIELKTTKDTFPKQSQPHVPTPPSQLVLPKPVVVSKARVLYNYKPTQPDELGLQVGEIVNVLDKNLEDEGWWKGEVNGHIGVFPDNFVEEIANTEVNSRKQQPAPASTMNNTANFTNANAILNAIDTASSLANQPSKLQVSSSSASSSTSSLTTTPLAASQSSTMTTTLMKEEQQPASPPPPAGADNVIPLSTEEAMKIDEMHADNKLTHLKKARQLNKRPPSFRLKSKGEKIEDAESLMAQLQPATEAPQPPVGDGAYKIKRDEIVNQSAETQSPAFKTPSPPPPPYTSPVSHSINTANTQSNANSSSSNNSDEMKSLKQEVDFLRDLTSKLSADYHNLQNETRVQKQTFDDQLQKFQKKLKDLVDEIDEEKKTRLALQVELERIKKTIST